MSSSNQDQANTAPTLAPPAGTAIPVLRDNVTDNNSVVTIRSAPGSISHQDDAVQTVDLEKAAPDGKEYKYLVKRFNFKVMLSTFACSLVVAYITFVNGVARNMSRLNYAHGIPYNTCMLLAFLVIACHALSAILASRGAVLCSDPDVINEKRYKVEEFKMLLSVCQHLNLYGIILFVFAVFGYSFFVFEDFVYPGLFCGLSLFAVAFIYFGNYRKLSLIHHDIEVLWKRIKRLFSGK